MAMGNKVLAIHDLSGYGNTSLMAIIPLMYHFGIEVCALPSMLLSANTCFKGYKTLNCSEFIQDCLLHYEALEMKFNAIYSGFLGDSAQVETVLKAIDQFGRDAVVLIDPVMADEGELYSCYDPSMITAMRTLIGQADIITPNYTEASFLADLDAANADDPGMWQTLCDKLHGLGAKEVIITSTPSSSGHSILYSAGPHVGLQCFPYKHIPCYYTGTGDIFSTLILAAALMGIERPSSIRMAADFISRSIQYSLERGREGSAGLLLHELIAALEMR